MPSVPIDGRPQFPMLPVVLANHDLGRPLFAGVETVTPGGHYILANSWPAPRTTSPSPAMPAQQAPDSRPKTAAAALWPNLK
jgi:hypothetical protein